MKPEQSYMKVVEWSDEDGCYIGSAPPLVGPCCHGATEAEAYRQLAVIVPDVVKALNERGLKLPEKSAGKEFNGKILARVSPELHRALTIRALIERRSLNSYIESALELAVAPPEMKRRATPKRARR
jgi:predicted HicB family RNase H-like nuclease